jgi:signal transduction histidine kinase
MSKMTSSADSYSFSEKPPKCILINILVVFDWLNKPLIERIRAEYGTRFVVLGTGSRASEIKEWLTDDDRYIAMEDVLELASSSRRSDGEEIAIAQSYESRMQIRYIRDVLQQDRGIAVNLMNQTPYSPFRRPERLNLIDHIASVNRHMEAYETLLKEEGVDLILSRSMDLQGAVLAELAHDLKIPLTFARNTRIKAGMTWASDAYVGADWNQEVFDKTPDMPLVDEDALVTPDGPRQHQDKLRETYGLKAVLKDMLKTTLFRIEFLLHDLRAWKRHKRLGYFAVLKARLNGYLCYRFMMRNKTDLSDIEGKSLFFPLSLDPEYTVQTLSKEFSDTRAMVQQIALALPVGTTLILKEHMRIGTRALSFYKDLLRLPNVVFVDPAVRGIDVVRHADGVASINSTASLEAAYMGKRSMVFSCHSEFTPIPSVTRFESFFDLPHKLKWILEDFDEAERQRIKKEAARFHGALISKSYEAEGVRYFGGDVSEIDPEEIEKAITLLSEVRASQLRRFSVKETV